MCVDPCAGVECSVGQVCQVDAVTRRPVCRCGGTGPGGSDLAGTVPTGNSSFTQPGGPLDPDGSVRGLGSPEGPADPYGSGGGTGPGGLCPMIYQPVCASDGHTYSNQCLMRVSACQRRRTDLRPLFNDECSAGNFILSAKLRALS